MVKGLKRAALAVTAASGLRCPPAAAPARPAALERRAAPPAKPAAAPWRCSLGGPPVRRPPPWGTRGQAFTTAAPDVTFKNAAVSGGGGSNARTVLSTRLQGGDPPDSWQLHPDQDLFAVVEDGSAADITDLYQANGWEAKLPDTVKNMLQKDGKYYAVPVNAHRANVLWTNPDALKKAGVSLSETTSITDFVAALPKIKDAGVTPVCLGAKDPFAPAQLLEVIIMANVGADGYNQLVTGQLPFDDPKVRTAVEQFKTVLENVNNDSAVITWDQAALNTADGKCATNLMGDWAYGELTNKGKKDGTDFSHVTFPGTGEIFDFVGDAFVIPAENAPNPEAEKVWLTQLLDPKVQSEFNLEEGFCTGDQGRVTRRLSRLPEEGR